MQTKFRGVLKYASEGSNATITFTSDWVHQRERAEEAVDELKPFMDGYGEWFNGYVEKKEIVD